MVRTSCIRVGVLLVLASLFGCSPDEPLRVTSIQIGRSLNEDKSVASHTTVFKPDDKIYASVLTTGTGSGTLTARWIYAGRDVSEPTRQVSYTGAAATDFQMASTGYTVGEYKIEILLDGEPAGSREFRVEK